MASRPTTGVSLPERYSVVRHIANGGMASVWEATDELLGRKVAVKVLSSSLAADEAARRRFTREARAAARLSTHPHVVTVYDAGEHDGQAFLVMALYPGGTVAERVKAGPLARPLALDWLEDTASALDLAHAEGVVHRDVKPANLLIDAGSRVAVADFGIATAAWETSMTSTGLVLGTIAYLAPEQRTGGQATPASDRYALGLVARELLTGAKPGQPPAAAVTLPGAAEVVLERATAQDPTVRPASCAALVDELEAALGDEPAPTAATRPVAPPRPRAAPVPLAADTPTAAHTAPAAVRAPVAAAPRTPPPSPAPPPAAPRSSGGSRALIALAVVALLIGVGAALALSGGDDARQTSASSPAQTSRTTTSGRTATAERSTSSASTPRPHPGSPGRGPADRGAARAPRGPRGSRARS
jgi:serine/threonine-protein kinase